MSGAWRTRAACRRWSLPIAARQSRRLSVTVEIEMVKRFAKKSRAATKRVVKAKPRAKSKPARRRRPIREATPPTAEQTEIDGGTADGLYEMRQHIRGELLNNIITLLRGRSRVPGDLALD